jgi:outer membrane protein assembly factor BamB
VADGKVYIGTEDGDVVILSADKSLKELRKVDMKAPVYGSVIAANATIYITTQTHLYAVNGTQTARATYSAPKGASARLRPVAHTPARFCSHPSHVQKRRALCPAENR